MNAIIKYTAPVWCNPVVWLLVVAAIFWSLRSYWNNIPSIRKLLTILTRPVQWLVCGFMIMTIIAIIINGYIAAALWLKTNGWFGW